MLHSFDDKDIDSDSRANFKYNMVAPIGAISHNDRLKAKVAIAWNSEVTANGDNPLSSKLTIDLDLIVQDSKQKVVASSMSYDNSYEVADFNAIPGESYQIILRRNSGSGSVRFGVAWAIEQTSWLLDRPSSTKVSANQISSGTCAIGSYATTNEFSAVQAGGKNSAELSFGPPQSMVPQVVTGINLVDMAKSSGNWAIRINATVDHVSEQQFTAHRFLGRLDLVQRADLMVHAGRDRGRIAMWQVR